MMTQDTELLPCPFCGSENVSRSLGENGDGTAYLYVECEDCAGNAEPEVWRRRAPTRRLTGDLLSRLFTKHKGEMTPPYGVSAGVWWDCYADEINEVCASTNREPAPSQRPGTILTVPRTEALRRDQPEKGAAALREALAGLPEQLKHMREQYSTGFNANVPECRAFVAKLDRWIATLAGETP